MTEPAHFGTSGTVFLVGAGPGDPDLLTLRAARLLMNAQVVVHDGLVDPAVLAMAPRGARFISVAKRRARHTMPQEEINALLVREALAGHDVVRLKGGDPFIFGRGGEEAEACYAAGESRGGARRERGARRFGCGTNSADPSRQCFDRLVRGRAVQGPVGTELGGLAGVGRTLVIYMGVASAAPIAEKLMADGLAPTMPLAVIENAARPQMRVLRGELAGLADLVARNHVKSPALIVIGEVAARGDTMELQTIVEAAR
jgi:uroporphyrin-III C-methyltransferase